MSNDPIVGIDLGTSNSVVAYADADGNVRVLADQAGYKVHPSVVSFHPNGGVVVAAAAKQRKVIDPKNTIFSVKRLIGRAFDSPEVQTARQRVPFQIKQHTNGGPGIVTRAGEYAIPEISAIVLDHVRHVANSALGATVNRAVVTVPASFNDAQRSATATAGSIAGLTVVRVLNEPTAAALAYGHTRDLQEVIAVYDFGGGTFDITLLKLHDQVYEVLGTAGDSFLGGDDLDERLVDKMVAAFLGQQRVDLRTNEVAMMRLRAVAEQTKIELSRRARAVVRVDEIAYGQSGKPLDLQIEIKRDEFVALVADLIDRTFPVCREALALAQLAPNAISDVILVGGTTKIPYVRDQVAKFFGKAARGDVNPEEAVALGAALQATALARVLGRSKSPSRMPTGSEPLTEDFQIAPGGTTSETTVPAAVSATDDQSGPSIASATAPQRATAAYGVARPTSDVRPGERAAQRGQHHDRFAQPADVPIAPPTPPMPLGRMIRNPPPVPGRARPPSGPPGRAESTTQVTASDIGVGTSPPPTATGSTRVPQPLALAQPHSTLPGTPAPAASPQAATLMLSFEPSGLDAFATIGLENAPSGTSRGIVAPTASGAITTLGSQQLARPPAPTVLDVTPRGLGIATVAGFCEELIRRNSRLPAETRKIFTTSRDHQDVVRIIVCQGESRRLDDNVVIGDLTLADLPPRPRGETAIEVTFHIDASGVLQVRARDAQTGMEQHASLDLVGGMPELELAASRERLQALRR